MIKLMGNYASAYMPRKILLVKSKVIHEKNEGPA